MKVDEATLRYIKEPEYHACAYGDMLWRPSGVSFVATLPVAGAADLRTELLTRVSTRAPSEPTILYLIGGMGWRIDHNQIHKGQRSTHLQREKGNDFFEELDPCTVGSPPYGPDVSPERVERAFRLSAGFLNIDISAVRWFDSPGGSS